MDEKHKQAEKPSVSQCRDNAVVKGQKGKRAKGHEYDNAQREVGRIICKDEYGT